MGMCRPCCARIFGGRSGEKPRPGKTGRTGAPSFRFLCERERGGPPAEVEGGHPPSIYVRKRAGRATRRKESAGRCCINMYADKSPLSQQDS